MENTSYSRISQTFIFVVFLLLTMWFAILLAAITLYILNYFYNSIRALILAWNVTGPPSVPLLGSALYFLNKTSEGKRAPVCANSHLVLFGINT